MPDIWTIGHKRKTNASAPAVIYSVFFIYKRISLFLGQCTLDFFSSNITSDRKVLLENFGTSILDFDAFSTTLQCKDMQEINIIPD